VAVTFDPSNLRIIEDATVVDGDTSWTWAEVYAEWKSWLRGDSSRAGYPPAFAVLGGEPLGGERYLGSTFFVINRWRFRPAEYDHTVTLVGNVASDPDLPSEEVWVPTIGDYQVAVKLQSTNLVDTIAVGSGVLPSDVTAIAAAVRDAILSDGTAFPGAYVDQAVSSLAGAGLTDDQSTQLDTIEGLLDGSTGGDATSHLSGEGVAYATRTDLHRVGLPAAALAGVSTVTQDAALEAASGLANAYIVRSGYDLPLSTWPAGLTLHVCGIAAWVLLSTRGFDPSNPSDKAVRMRFDDAIKWLEKVAKGTVSLGSYRTRKTVTSGESRGY